MKAILEYILPEEMDEYKQSIHSGDYLLALEEIRDLLRNKYKYGHDHKTADEAIEKIYDEYYQILNKHSIEI